MFSFGGGGGGFFGGGGGGGWGRGGGGMSDEEYQNYIEQMRKEREERLARMRKAQKEVDECTDPNEKIALNRKRYKCAEYITVDNIPKWPAVAARLKDEAAGKKAGAGAEAPKKDDRFGGGEFGFFMMRRPALQFDKTDLQARFDVDDVLNAKICLIRGDITSLELDAIVNAANSSLMGGGGVDGAIHSAAGPLLEEACRPLNGAETGETKMTAGFALPAKFVLHTVGPVERGDRQLRSCYRGCLDLCIKHGLKTVAFCGIGTGIYGFPLKRASHIALDETRKFLMSLKNGTYKSVEEQERAEQAKQKKDAEEEQQKDDDGSSTEAVPQSKAVAAATNSAAAVSAGPKPTLDSIQQIVFCVFTAEELQCYEGLIPSYFPVEGFPATKYDPSNPDHDAFNNDDARPAWGGSSSVSGGDFKYNGGARGAGAASDFGPR